MLPNLAVLALLFLSFLPPTSPSPSENQSSHSPCSPLSYVCGASTINVSYPFQVAGRPAYCGRQGYNLRCSKNSTLLTTIGNRDFQVMAVDYVNRHLAVVDSRLLADPCPHPTYNITVDPSLYLLTDLDRALTLLMNCSFPSELPPEFHKVSCGGGNSSFYYLGDGDFNGSPENCGSAMKVVMHQAVVDLVIKNEVGLGDALQQGFTLGWTAGGEWCDECVAAGGFCGFNSSLTTGNTCLCGSVSCSFASRSRVAKKIIIGLTVGLSCLLFACISLYFYISRNTELYNLLCQRNKTAQSIEAFLETCETLGPKRYKYADVKKITKSFSEKLGQGGYGAVFKGKLPDSRLVAVKILNNAKGNGDEFVNEVASIGRTSHVNVVSLLGFCSDGSKRALLYEFMPNGSLDKYIFSEELKSTVGWEKLFQIAVAIARGLEYLHRGCKTHIVHFDIKPHNILLDQDFAPKISDFGLAKLCLRKDRIFSAVDARGTIGYIAPEVFSRNFGTVSSKSDVYSYGMMVLEMVGGKKVVNSDTESSSEAYFPNWIYEHLDRTCELEGVDVVDEAKEIVKKMIVVGLWCIQTKPESRPSMNEVVDMLESSVSELELPPKPCLGSP